MGNRDIRRSVEGRGMGNMGNTRWTLQGLSRRKAGTLKEVGLGGLTGVEKIEDLVGGREEGVGNSCFEGLEGRIGLTRAREFIPKAGKKRMKE